MVSPRAAAVIIAGLLGTAMAFPAGVSTAAERKKPFEQRVEGTVMLYSPLPCGYTQGETLPLPMPNGMLFHHFKVDKRTWGHRFTLVPTGNAQEVDLDLTFGNSSGSPRRMTEGESWYVPEGATDAWVCQHPRSNGGGFGGASFVYEAGPDVKAPEWWSWTPHGEPSGRKTSDRSTQKLEGSVMLSESFHVFPVWSLVADGTYGGCGEGVMAHFLGFPNGTAGYVFDVDRRTWGRTFVLEPRSARTDDNLDIYFLGSRLRTLASGDVYPGAERMPPPHGHRAVFREGRSGGEFGRVPKGAAGALVCLQNVTNLTVGFDEVAFTYEAGHGVHWPSTFTRRD